MTEFDAVEEAERFLKSLRQPDLVYLDPAYVDSQHFADWGAVATYGRASELTGANDEPEIAPIRLRLGNEDGDETEVYFTIAEASEFADAIRKACRQARRFPQPETGGQEK